MIRKKLIAGVVGSLALAAQVTGASFSDLVGGYNVVTFGDFTAAAAVNGGDQIHGALSLAAEGNVMSSGCYGFGADNNNGNYNFNTVVSGGDVTLNGDGSVYGSVVAGGTVQKSSSFNILGTTTENANVSDYYDFNSVKENLSYVSGYIAEQAEQSGLHANKVGYQGKGLCFEGVVDADVNYFTVNASDLGSVDYFEFKNISNTAKTVINVKGTDVSMGNVGWGGFDKAYGPVLFWNFEEATTLNIGGSFNGSLLALNADTRFVDGEIWGNVAVKSASGKIEYHEAPYTGDFPPPENVPESSTVTMILIGAFALMFVSRKNIALLRK